MRNNDIEGIDIELRKIYDKMLQALKLRVQVSKRRHEIIGALEKINFAISDQKEYIKRSEALVKELRKCHNDERRIISITAPAILRTQNILVDITQGNEDKLSKGNREILRYMIDSLDFINKNISLAKTRIGMEEVYMASPNEETYNQYATAWRNEYTAEEKLIKMINPANLGPLSRFRNVERYAESAVGGATTGLLFGFFTTEKIDTSRGATISLWTIVGFIAGILIQYKKETDNLITIQKEALLSFRPR
ncbi:MAG: hypothetical protein ACP5NW_00430 [Candidatus Woesearchaeota archaeon]